MMRRVAATAVVPRRSSSSCGGSGGCYTATNLSATIGTKPTNTSNNKFNNNIRLAKRYITSDDYSKIGASAPVVGRGGSVRSSINGHNSQFLTLSIPLVLVSAYFALFPTNQEQVEEAIREKYEKEINEISTANTIMDQYGAPNSAKALEREKNLELFYKHTIKGMGKNSISTAEKTAKTSSTAMLNDEERANVIEMEQRLQSVLLGGKEEGALDQNIISNATSSDEKPAIVNAKAIARDATAIVSKNALIDDGKSRNPYSKVTFEEQQNQKQQPMISKQQKNDSSKEIVKAVDTGTENVSTSNNNTGVTKAATVGIITTATIALALLAGGSGNK